MDSWNDARLDELSGRVDAGFGKVDQRLEGLEGKLGELATREELKALATKRELGELKVEVRGLKREVGEVKVELRNLNEKLDRLILVLMASAASLGITGLATIAGLIATQA